MITNPQTGTNVCEIAEGIYRINTPIDFPDGQGFSFNQYLLVYNRYSATRPARGNRGTCGA